MIGADAGEVWHYLNDNGTANTAAIGRHLGIPAKSVHRAIGWLAREGKVAFVGTTKGERVELSEKA